MRWAHILVFLAVFGAALVGAPADSPFTFPTTPPAPVPAPTPGATLTLSGDALYVVNAKTDASLRGYPAGLVAVTKEAGPLRVRGKFIDGTGKVETRTYPGPHVFIVEAAGTGRVDLVLTPFGLKAEAEIETRTVDVDAGQGPIPPPKPKPDPVTPVTSFRVIFVFESGTTPTAAQSSVMSAKVVRDYLNAKCTKEGTQPGWRQYDPDINTANEQPTMKALWAAVKPKLPAPFQPCIVVEVNGKAEILPFPASAADAVVLFKQYAEGK